MCSSSDLLLSLLAVLFPPIAVWIRVGICTFPSLLNLLLTAIGYIPGLLHAWYVVAAYPDPTTYVYDYEALDPLEAGEGVEGVWIYVRNPRRARQAIVRKAHPDGYGPAAHPHVGAGGAGQERGQQQPRGYGTVDQQPQPAEGMDARAGGSRGEGSAGGRHEPPSYAEVVAGDHKVQQQD